MLDTEYVSTVYLVKQNLIKFAAMIKTVQYHIKASSLSFQNHN